MLQIKNGSNNILNETTVDTNATIISYAEITCRLPGSPLRPGWMDSLPPSSAHGLLLSITTNGIQYSDPYFITVYDSVCQKCKKGGECELLVSEHVNWPQRYREKIS